MAAPVFEKRYKQDIVDPVKVRRCGDIVFTGDALSDTIFVEVYNDGVPYNLTGTVTLNCIRADGATVAVTGSISGNVAQATLAQACCAISGPLALVMKITADGVTSTILKAIYTVDVGVTGTTVDPGTIVSNVNMLLAAINAAVASVPSDYSDLLAAIAPNYSDLTFPVKAGQKCWYDGDYYRAKVNIETSESWTSAHWELTVLSEDVDEGFAELKDVTYSTGPDTTIWEQGKWNVTNGNKATDSKVIRSEKFGKDFCVSVNVLTGYEFSVLCWDSTDTFLGSWTGTTFSKSSNTFWREEIKPADISGASTFAINARTNPSGTDITPSAATNIIFQKTEASKRVPTNQGAANAGKILVVGANGNITLSPTDQTLTISGAAADAKIVGDVFFAESTHAVEWSTGAWSNTGNVNTSTKYIRTAPFQCAKTIVRVNQGYYVSIGKWDNSAANSDAHFVENLIGGWGAAADVRQFVFAGETGYWYRVSIKKADNSDIDTTAASNAQIIDRIDRINEKADEADVDAALLLKLNVPTAGYGTSGQVLKSNGTSYPVWADDEPISGEEIKGYVEDWLEENPQAYVSIEDGSIGENKFAQSALRYVTPAMFGAVGDGETSDSVAIQRAINYAAAHGCVLDGKGKTYALDGEAPTEGGNPVYPPGWTSQRPIRGLFASSSITIQNMNLVLVDNATEGTSGLHIKCDKGQRIIIDNVNIDGNRANQSSTVGGDGNMTGIKIGLASQYDAESGSGSIIVQNCYIKNCYTDGIGIAATDYENLVIRDCIIEGAGRNGITDNSLNGIVTGCHFINNGMRTAPRTQYETEPEQIRALQTRVLDNCTFVSDYNNIVDIVFLLKTEKVAQSQSDSIEHLVISNCQCKTIAIQSQTADIASVFKHITIRDTNCDEIRFVPNSAENHIADNQDMNIINCKVGDISITVGNVKIAGCDVSGAISLSVDSLIISNCRLKRDAATTLAPTATNGIIDGNILTNYTLDTTNITNFVGSNVPQPQS